jgi:hypothetical protein
LHKELLDVRPVCKNTTFYGLEVGKRVESVIKMRKSLESKRKKKDTDLQSDSSGIEDDDIANLLVEGGKDNISLSVFSQMNK